MGVLHLAVGLPTSEFPDAPEWVNLCGEAGWCFSGWFWLFWCSPLEADGPSLATVTFKLSLDVARCPAFAGTLLL